MSCVRLRLLLWALHQSMPFNLCLAFSHMLLVLAFRLAKLTAPDKLWQNIIILQPLSLPFIDPLSGGYQLNQRKRLTKNKPCGNQVLEGRTFMPEDFENKKRGSLRLPWWVPLLLLLAVAIFIGILLANIFPEIWRRIPLTSPP